MMATSNPTGSGPQPTALAEDHIIPGQGGAAEGGKLAFLHVQGHS